MAARPLSPHLGVYRFAYTMSLSILHRAAGLGLSVGLVVLAAWLLAVAEGEAAYRRFTAFMGLGLLKLVLALWLLGFVHHLANGVRHLFWDAGMGFERAQARRSAALVVAFDVVAALVLLYVFFCPQGVRS